MKAEKKEVFGTIYGVVFGTSLGVLTHHLVFWLSFGIALGTGAGILLMKRTAESNPEKTPKESTSSGIKPQKT